MRTISHKVLLSATRCDHRLKIAIRRSSPGNNTSPEPGRHLLRRRLRILSIDGGGMRAILPAALLACLEERLQELQKDPHARIVEYFDLVAGTSAGGMLAGLYLTPHPSEAGRPKYSAREILEMYLAEGCESFTPLQPDAGRQRTEKYCADILEQKLQDHLGADTLLGELIRPSLITAYDLEQERPILFKSWEAVDAKAWQVCRATSAAPGLFRPACFPALAEGRSLIDGSIFAGSPALCAYTAARTTAFSQLGNCTFQQDFPDVGQQVMLSLGTGQFLVQTENRNQNWLRTLLRNQLISGVRLVDQQLGQLFASGKQYHRHDPYLTDTALGIDEVGAAATKLLHDTALAYVAKHQKELDRLLLQLIG